MKKIVLLTGLLFISSNLFALTKSQLISEIRLLVNDNPTETSRYRWTDLQISTFINIAQQEINGVNWCLKTRTTLTLTAGVTEYILPTDFFAMERVYYDNDVLKEISLSKLDDIDSMWLKSSTGTPSYYYVRIGTVTWLGLYPAPDNRKDFDIYYYQIPANLDTNSLEPFNNLPRLRPYHHLITLWVAYYCMLQEGRLNSATQYYTLYNAGLKNMREIMNLTPNFYPNISGGN